MRRLRSSLFALAVVLCAAAPPLIGGQAAEGHSVSAGVDAQDLVRRTVAHELQASESSAVNHMFLSRKKSAHGSQTKLYVETSQAMAGLAIANDDHPLTAEQRAAEFERLDRLSNDPSELSRKHAREKEDAERVRRIVRSLPDAFLFEIDGKETGREGIGKPGSELIRLRFKPNPKFEPPSRVEQVLQGMEGTLLVDPVQGRIARIDGTLFREVGFGWGILGHLDRGGKFLVDQEDLGDGSWDASRMTLHFTGTILLVKHLDIQSDEVFQNYRRVASGMTFAQGVDLLKKESTSLTQASAADEVRASASTSGSHSAKH
jgi:hypothetical protein